MVSNSEEVDASIADAFLGEFKENNSHVQIRATVETIIIESPWGAENIIISCSLNDHDFYSELNQIIINPIFDAIFHRDTNELEFIFAFLDNEESYRDRAFKMHFEGHELDCVFKEPTVRFMELAKRSMNVLSDNHNESVKQIRMFRDFQRLEDLPQRAKTFFETKVPRNFFINLPEKHQDIDLVKVAYHLNFIHRYYDRLAPEIVVREESKPGNKESRTTPTRFIASSFPSEFSVGSMDEIILQLVSVARISPARQAFIYYYQVLEYSGHYYVDDKAKSQIKKLLRDPTVIDCDDGKIGELFSLLTDVNHNDDVKMRKLIEETVSPDVIWKEIQNDIEFFSSKIEFEGGFVLQPLVSSDISEQAWQTMWMPKLFDQLTRIRNCLVHARERRENKVILPTNTNNLIISRYKPIIERVALQICLATPTRL